MTVKEKKRGRPPAHPGERLNAESIVLCARILLLEDGKVPSIRKVASELNVDPMAIYHYFANKAALLEALTVSLIGEIYQPRATNDWQDELRKLCESYISLLKGHGCLLETLLSISAEGPTQIFAERFRIALSALQLGEADLKDALDLLVDYLHGFALAMTCDTTQKLDIKDMQGPLLFYMKSLARFKRLPA